MKKRINTGGLAALVWLATVLGGVLKAQTQIAAPGHSPSTQNTTNSVLVAGDLPLSLGDVWRLASQLEWTLDVQLTPAQRQEYQRFAMEDWHRQSSAGRLDAVRSYNAWNRSLGKFGPTYESRQLQSRRQAAFLAGLRRTPSTDFSQWALRIYEEAHYPGGERNRVLCPGAPPLTQDMLEHYCVYLEWVLDLSVVQGFTAEQRRALQGMVITDWHMAAQPMKADLLAGVKQWDEVCQLNDTDRDRAFQTLSARFITQLRAAPNSEARRLLLSVYNLSHSMQDLQSQGIVQSGFARNPIQFR